MSSAIPIGQRESQTLEFKAAAALRNLPAITREVVAFLNAGGGRLWIGLNEHDGIATSVDPVAAAEQRRIDILNHLIDVVRPTPSGNEVLIRVEKDSDDRELLCIETSPRTPGTVFYFRKDGGRFYVKRIDHRIRAMTEDEIDAKPGAPVTPSPLRARRDSVLEEHKAVFWVGIQPLPRQKLDIQNAALDALLREPTRSGNRVDGWNFRFPFSKTSELIDGRLALGDPALRQITVAKDGGIEFRQALDRLKWNDGDRAEIYPLALLEYVTSLLRLARKVYELPMEPGVERMLVDLALTGVGDWTLPAYAPDTHGYLLSMEGPPLAQVARPGRSRHPDLTFDQPLAASMKEVRDNPDDVAFRVVREVYEQFGLREEHIPRQFDRVQRRLVLPD